MAQGLKEAGILYNQVDASDSLCGNWYHGVYETAHIISSGKVTQLGLVFKSIGQSLPKTHLSDPHQVFKQLKLLNLGFNLLAKKAHQIEAKYPDFNNKPLPAQKIDRLVCVK